MEALIRALTSRLSGSALPLYLADAVPENTAFPYMTADVVSPLHTDQAGSIRLTLWTAGADANLARMVLHTTILQHLPGRGMVLEDEHGRYVLTPETAALVQSGEARGICTPIAVRYYPEEKEAEQT